MSSERGPQGPASSARSSISTIISKGNRMSVRRNMTLVAGASALWMSPGYLAFGQQTAQPVASGDTGFEEIIVTARRREERLQSVPVAITAFSPDTLQQK